MALSGPVLNTSKDREPTASLGMKYNFFICFHILNGNLHGQLSVSTVNLTFLIHYWKKHTAPCTVNLDFPFSKDFRAREHVQAYQSLIISHTDRKAIETTCKLKYHYSYRLILENTFPKVFGIFKADLLFEVFSTFGAHLPGIF